MTSENVIEHQKNVKKWVDRGLKRFGHEKPAIAGPGRPPLPEGVKARQAFLRAKIQEASPRAIEVLMESLNAKQERDRIRAAEILVTHSLPRQEEVTLDDDRVLGDVPAEVLEARLAHIRSRRNGDSRGTEVKA